MAPTQEIVKIIWRAIALPEWQSIASVETFSHGIVNGS
jgi:hypothetical protein